LDLESAETGDKKNHNAGIVVGENFGEGRKVLFAS